MRKLFFGLAVCAALLSVMALRGSSAGATPLGPNPDCVALHACHRHGGTLDGCSPVEMQQDVHCLEAEDQYFNVYVCDLDMEDYSAGCGGGVPY